MARAKIQKSRGNVFRDLGFGPEEAASLKIRADLMIAIERLMKRRELTQSAAAKLLGVTQPRVSDLVRGKIELFSIDMLVDMLTRAEVRVRVNVQGLRGKAKHAEAANDLTGPGPRPTSRWAGDEMDGRKNGPAQSR